MGRETLQQQIAAGERAGIDDREREERIANCEMEFSDGFLSSWAAGLTQQKGRIAADLLANGGKAYFFRFELINADTGEKVNAKLIDGTYGECWMLLDGGDRRTGKFVTAHAKREATMARKGYRERIVIFEADAIAAIAGSGKGLAGATSCRAVTRCADYELEKTAAGRAGLTREDAEAWIEQVREGSYKWQEIIFA